MTQPVYATLADFKTWKMDESAEISDVLLARASLAVDELLIGAVYTVDATTQFPTDTETLQAVKDATCAEAEWLDELGDTTGSGAVTDPRNVQSASIGSVSYSTASSSGSGSTSAAALTESGISVGPVVIQILRVAGLRPTFAQVRG